MYGVILIIGLTISALAAPPDCKSVGSGKYPGETCNQYYECTKTIWSYNVKSQECPDGQIFDPVSKNCSVGSCSEAEITAATQSAKEEITVSSTSTTTVRPVTAATPTADIPPNCKLVGAGNYPAEQCNQYYQCAKAMWWYNIKLQTCPDVVPPICKLVGPGNYPAENCQYYYQCTKVMWWYNTKLQKCPDDQIFNMSSKSCSVGSCSSSSSSTETTTTASMSSTRTVQSTTKPNSTTSQVTTSTKDLTPSPASTATKQATTTAKSVSPPNCKSVGPGNYPSENCRQYYQCTKTMWWYNIELQTCPDGQIFDFGSKNCADVSPPNCRSVGPGNYPAENCRQYYQCTKIIWWYNTELKTCTDDQIFDFGSKSCADGASYKH